MTKVDQFFDAIQACGHDTPNTVTSMLALNRTSIVPPADEMLLNVTITEEIITTPHRYLRAIAGAAEGSWTMVADEGFELKAKGFAFFSHFYFEKMEGAEEEPQDGDNWNQIGEYVERRKRLAMPYPNVLHVFLASEAHQSAKNPIAFIQDSPQSVEQADRILELADLPSSSKTVSHRTSDNLNHDPSFLHKEIRNHSLPMGPMPKDFDWREFLEGMPGTDNLGENFAQGGCGSCYAFAAVLTLQARFRIRLKKQYDILYPLELSYKSVVQCSPYTAGCHGGWPYLAFKQTTEVGVPLAECDSAKNIKSLDDMCTWECYRSTDGRTPPVLFHTADYGMIGGFAGGSSEEYLIRELYTNGPVCITITTNVPTEFKSGQTSTPGSDVMMVMNNDKKMTEEYSTNEEFKQWTFAGHIIVATGYGEQQVGDDTVKYWHIRNSWRTHWGKHGYAKLRRGHNDASTEFASAWVLPDMTRLPNGFLELAQDYHNKHVGASSVAAA
eukprot:NODE_5543_length_1759_cov_3.511642.p1 GENE.NODE_5543_length_1759_cov_3.511642~~NODE_5543_length_1759_cov_3.511642.p1  ORF type:complete len:514 (+),score=113.20 NODE_5543_length_1759_cov_3.511642:49-1542(+)